MMCITTRFRLKHTWCLAPMYLAYWRMRRTLRTTPGLIRFAFLLQSPVVCYTFSIWESEAALVEFSNVPEHLHAVRHAPQLCRRIWSAYWRVDGVSKHARQWQGYPSWPSLTQHPTRRGRLVERSIVERSTVEGVR